MQLNQEVRMVTREGDIIYRQGTTGVADALQATDAAKLQPQYAPELANFRSNAPADNALWGNWIFTPSILATGRTEAGSKVVVYAHVPNYLSNHENIRAAVQSGNLRAGAGALPQKEFQRLVDLDGQTDDKDIRRVWVVDYDKLKGSSSGSIPIEKAMEHPQTIPFIGSVEGAQKYLTAHAQAYKTKGIGVWRHDDFDESSPRARLLLFGIYDNGGLSDNDSLNNNGRFLGVAPEAQSRAKNRPTRPTLNQIVSKVGEDLPGVDVKALERALGPLYQK